MADSSDVRFLKGHGTKNDFVIIPDRDATLELSARQVARICDRRSGIGADGVLRVVPTDAVADATQSSSARWFMDYRNADGSIAEMCGNGARVFAHFLVDEGWEDGPEFTIATRAGRHDVVIGSDGEISVGMGAPADGVAGRDPIVSLGGRSYQADAWWLPNPHAVVFVEDLEAFDTPLPEPEVVDHRRFPTGQNVEFVHDVSIPGQLHAEMRVHERGVGETLSCGTGACAVSLSVRKRHGVEAHGTSAIDVPGGRLRVHHTADGRINLIGPAELVGRGTFDPDWWENAE